MPVSRKEILNWLEDVKDPEIPAISLVDLGVITAVDIQGDKVTVEMTPTFVGCPALDFMKEEVVAVLQQKGIAEVDVQINFHKPWSSDRITDKGKAALQKFGIAPPPPGGPLADLQILEYAACPRCRGTNTEMRNLFGPTLCRSIHYCRDCREAFEQFKPL